MLTTSSREIVPSAIKTLMPRATTLRRMATRDLSSSQVERLRAVVKQLWATGKYKTKTDMAEAGRVFQAQISNLINGAPVGISFPTAEKICRNLFGKKAEEVIGAPDDPALEKSELEIAIDMARAGHIPDEAISAVLSANKQDAPYGRWDWLHLFRGAAYSVVQRDAAQRPRRPAKHKKRVARQQVDVATPHDVKRKAAGS